MEEKENLQNEASEKVNEQVAEPTAEEKLKEELAEEHDKLLRVMAEYDNFRKRSIKEKEQAYGDTKASTIGEFLPIYDNFQRAMASDTNDFETLKKGMEMIFNQYGEILKKLGVESFGAKGDTFDPNIHNAVMHDEDDSLPENSISDVFSAGYKIGDRVIRPAVVKVVN